MILNDRFDTRPSWPEQAAAYAAMSPRQLARVRNLEARVAKLDEELRWMPSGAARGRKLESRRTWTWRLKQARGW